MDFKAQKLLSLHDEFLRALCASPTLCKRFATREIRERERAFQHFPPFDPSEILVFLLGSVAAAGICWR
jgi:hypothetical protein